MNNELLNRDWRIQVDTLDVSGLDFSCEIKKSLLPEPNTCTLTLYNLSEAHRKQIEGMNLYDPKKVKGAKPAAAKPHTEGRAPKPGKIRVQVEAGYKTTGTSLLFRGDLRRAVTSREGPNWVTKIEGEDGGHSVLASRINHSFPPGTTRLAVVKECAAGLGLGLGNIIAVQDLLTDTYPNGTILSGSAADELRGVLRRAGVSYSIQNGVLQFTQAGQGLQTQAVLVSEGTGMVGSPERDATGALLVKTLLIPNLSTGGYISLKSASYAGTFVVRGITHELNNKGTEWYHSLECWPG